MRRKGLAVAVLLLVAVLGIMVACSSQPSFVIGVQSDEVSPLTVENKTGQGISSIQVKSTGDEGYSFTLQQEGDFPDGEKALLYYPSDMASRGAVDMRVSLASGASYEIHELDMAAMEDVAICFSEADQMVYLEYTVPGTDEQKSTLDSEKAYLAAVEQAKQEEEARLAAEREAAEKAEAERIAAEQAAAEQAAAEQAAAEQAAREEAERKAAEEEAARQAEAEAQAAAERERREASKSSGSSSSSSSSGEDQCVDDIILN